MDKVKVKKPRKVREKKIKDTGGTPFKVKVKRVKEEKPKMTIEHCPVVLAFD